MDKKPVSSRIERAIQLKTQYNIRVLNLSLGHPVYESYTLDPLCSTGFGDTLKATGHPVSLLDAAAITPLCMFLKTIRPLPRAANSGAFRRSLKSDSAR